MGPIRSTRPFAFSAGIASAGVAPASRPAAIDDGGWQLAQLCLDKNARVAHPEITAYSGKGSSEVTP